MNTITCTTIRELNFAKAATPVVIPTGTTIQLYFKTEKPARAYFMHNGIERPLSVSHLHLTVKSSSVKFRKAPSLRAMEKANDAGVMTTVTGAKVEPDGHDEYGAASWLLVMGLI